MYFPCPIMHSARGSPADSPAQQSFPILFAGTENSPQVDFTWCRPWPCS